MTDKIHDLAAERAKRAAAAEESEVLSMFLPSLDANVRDDYVFVTQEETDRPISLVVPPGTRGLTLTIEQAEQIGMELIAVAGGMRMMEQK